MTTYILFVRGVIQERLPKTLSKSPKKILLFLMSSPPTLTILPRRTPLTLPSRTLPALLNQTQTRKFFMALM
jgi:hypothetical protein